MKKLFKLGAWICGIIAIVMMLLGIIAVFAGNQLMGHLWSNYFYPAYNFIVLGIFLFLAILVEKDTKA